MRNTLSETLEVRENAFTHALTLRQILRKGLEMRCLSHKEQPIILAGVNMLEKVGQ